MESNLLLEERLRLLFLERDFFFRLSIAAEGRCRRSEGVQASWVRGRQIPSCKFLTSQSIRISSLPQTHFRISIFQQSRLKVSAFLFKLPNLLWAKINSKVHSDTSMTSSFQAACALCLCHPHGDPVKLPCLSKQPDSRLKGQCSTLSAWFQNAMGVSSRLDRQILLVASTKRDTGCGEIKSCDGGNRLWLTKERCENTNETENRWNRENSSALLSRKKGGKQSLEYKHFDAFDQKRF